MTAPTLPQIMRFGAACSMAMTIAGHVLAETPAPADTAQEETFLDILPAIEIPEDVRPIPGAVNEEFRNCQAAWPTDYENSQSGPESRPLRDIYSYVRARNVIATQDCTCVGKVAKWEDVEAVAGSLREQLDAEVLSWQNTKAISAEARELIAVAETMCGGAF